MSWQPYRYRNYFPRSTPCKARDGIKAQSKRTGKCLSPKGPAEHLAYSRPLTLHEDTDAEDSA